MDGRAYLVLSRYVPAKSGFGRESTMNLTPHEVLLKLAFVFASLLLDPQCCMENFESLSNAHRVLRRRFFLDALEGAN